ncbi:MAG: AAA family ATPase [Candidatus Woesearchaeota archaeon]|nr:AAA family ATPase [Candidatus Woesearchaeota archaeon]
MTWYNKLGFHSNPFSIKPAAYSSMVAYDVDYLIKKIKDSEMIFIEGEYGTGKTTILKTIINNFRGKNKIIYYSFNSESKFDIEKLVDGANSVIRKVTGLKHRNMILMLDETHTMTAEEGKEVLRYYQEGILQSVVFVSNSYQEMDIYDELKNYLKNNVIKTVALNQDEAIELIRSRIGDISLFSKKVLKRIFDLSDKNPRRFLEYCEDIARYAVERDEMKVLDEHVDAVLKIKPEAKVEPKKFIEEPKAKKVEEKVNIEEKPKKVEAPKKEIQKEQVKVAIVKEKPHKEAIKQEPIATVEEIKEVELEAKESKEESDDDDKKRPKKFKINKLVEGSKDPLGEIQASEAHAEKKEDGKGDTPEYKVFAFDN